MESSAIKHRIIVAGIGPGNPDYMIPAARDAIRGAKALAGGRRALAQFAESGRQHTMVIAGDIPGVMEFVRRELEQHDVVVMVSGDPGYYSLLDALRRYFPHEPIQVIPGISAMQMAFSRLALPWHDAQLVSFHGRRPEAEQLTYQPGRIIGMLTDGRYTSRTIPPILMKQGWPDTAKLHICARLTYEDETICTTTLGKSASLPETGHGILIVEG